MSLSIIVKTELNNYEQLNETYLDKLAVKRQKIEDAQARGRSEGKVKAKAEGIVEELVKGEAKGRIEIAKKMLSQNYLLLIFPTLPDYLWKKYLKYK